MTPAPIARHISRNGLGYALLCMALLALALHYLALPKITSRMLQRLPNERPYAILLPQLTPDFWNPWNVPDNRPGSYRYNFTLDYQPYQQSRFAVYPTGCIDMLQVNNRNVALDANRKCNRDTGFAVDLQPYLHPGVNQLQVFLSNIRVFRGSRSYDTGTYGLQLGPMLFGSPDDTLSAWLSLLLIASTAAALILFIKRFTGEYFSGLILSLGLLVYLRWLKATSYMQYTIDMPSHFQYISYIANHGFAPKPNEGWEYYHPPLYYQVEAAIIRWCNWLGSFDAMTAMRLFSLACFMVFLLFCVLMLHRLIGNRIAFCAAVTLLVFYPGGIVYSSRLDSHLLLYSFYGGCFYFLMRWIQENRIGYCWLALACFGLALGTRSNALALLPVIGLACLYQFRAKRLTLAHLRSYGMAASLAVIALGMAANFGRTAQSHATDHNDMPYIVGNIDSVQKSQYVETTLENLLLLDTQTLFTPPFVDWWHNNTGRQYFWNSVLKTSLFEHFRWRSVELAQCLLSLLLALIVYMAASLWRMRLDKRMAWSMCSLSLAASLGVLMANRIIHPYAPSQDFRYIYPALVSFCGIVGLIIEQYLALRQPKRAALGIGLILLFSWASVSLIQAG